MKFEHEYIITSERAFRRHDELDNTFYSNEVYEVGDVIEMDGLKWTVEEVVR